MHCLTARGQWEVELLQCNASLPEGSGHWKGLRLSIGASCYVSWHCSHSPLVVHISKFCCPSSTELLLRVQRNDSMTLQRWGMALPVMPVPFCRVYC